VQLRPEKERGACSGLRQIVLRHMDRAFITSRLEGELFTVYHQNCGFQQQDYPTTHTPHATHNNLMYLKFRFLNLEIRI